MQKKGCDGKFSRYLAVFSLFECLFRISSISSKVQGGARVLGAVFVEHVSDYVPIIGRTHLYTCFGFLVEGEKKRKEDESSKEEANHLPSF